MTITQTHTRVQRLRFASFEEKAAPVVPVAKKNQEAVPQPPAPPVLPVITERDVEVARSESFAKGFEQGAEEAQSKIDQEKTAREEATGALLDIIANRITLAAEAHAARLKEQQAILGKLVMAIAQKVAGEALKREPFAMVESLLRECVGLVAGEAKIVIAVSPARSDGLRQCIDTLRPLLQGYEGELQVTQDSALTDQDCRVEWKNGYAERSTTAIWNDIEAIVAKASAGTS